MTSVGAEKSKHLLTVKCVVVGDEGVGKSCFISRLSGSPFRSEYCKTMVDMATVRTMREGTLMLLDCWDTPGMQISHILLSDR